MRRSSNPGRLGAPGRITGRIAALGVLLALISSLSFDAGSASAICAGDTDYSKEVELTIDDLHVEVLEESGSWLTLAEFSGDITWVREGSLPVDPSLVVVTATVKPPNLNIVTSSPIPERPPEGAKIEAVGYWRSNDSGTIVVDVTGRCEGSLDVVEVPDVLAYNSDGARSDTIPVPVPVLAVAGAALVLGGLLLVVRRSRQRT